MFIEEYERKRMRNAHHFFIKDLAVLCILCFKTRICTLLCCLQLIKFYNQSERNVNVYFFQKVRKDGVIKAMCTYAERKFKFEKDTT